MVKQNRAAMDQHNLEQQRYYARGIKKNMIPSGSRYLRRHVSELVQATELEPPARILEVGCGMGRYTLLLAEAGFQVEGVDLSAELLTWLAEFNAGRFPVTLHCMDVVNFPLEYNGQFDGVIGFFVLHHVHQLEEIFRAMQRLVKPGGRVAFIEPNPYNLLYYLQFTFSPRISWKAERGIFQMRPEVLFPAMQAAGIGSLKLKRFGFFPPFLANSEWGHALESRLEKVSLWQSALPFLVFSGTSS